MYLDVAWGRQRRELGRQHDCDTPLDGDHHYGVQTDQGYAVSEEYVDTAAESSPREHVVDVGDLERYG